MTMIKIININIIIIIEHGKHGQRSVQPATLTVNPAERKRERDGKTFGC